MVVLLQMSRQVPTVIELLAAKFAAEWLDPRVYPLVYREISTVTELLVAHAALVRLHARVSPQVRRQVSTVAKHFPCKNQKTSKIYSFLFIYFFSKIIKNYSPQT